MREFVLGSVETGNWEATSKRKEGEEQREKVKREEEEKWEALVVTRDLLGLLLLLGWF